MQQPENKIPPRSIANHESVLGLVPKQTPRSKAVWVFVDNIRQALGSEAVSRNVAVISGVAVETANGARSASESIQSLAEQAEQLRSSLRHFRLPEDSRRPAADRDVVAA